MRRRRVLLFCNRSLLAESIEHILGNLEDVELIGLWDLDPNQASRIREVAPDIVLVAEDETNKETAALITSQLLEQNSDLPVARIGIRDNTLRLFTSHSLPAQAAKLIELVRSLPSHESEETEHPS